MIKLSHVACAFGLVGLVTILAAPWFEPAINVGQGLLIDGLVCILAAAVFGLAAEHRRC